MGYGCERSRRNTSRWTARKARPSHATQPPQAAPLKAHFRYFLGKHPSLAPARLAVLRQERCLASSNELSKNLWASPHANAVPDDACMWVSRVVGGAEEDRTPDLLLARQVLSQLSYGPGLRRRGLLVGPGGFEPPTSPLSEVRSDQLSYGPARGTALRLGRRPASQPEQPMRPSRGKQVPRPPVAESEDKASV